MSKIIEFPGKLPARPTKKAGLVLIGAALRHLSPPLRIADQCRFDLSGIDQTLLHLNDSQKLAKQFLPAAKLAHSRMLPHVAAVDAAYKFLARMFIEPIENPLTHASAIQMLTVLFASLAKTKGDNLKLKLIACASMFEPGSDAVGEILGIWKPVSRHPAILAIAVKKLLATAIFSPTPSELRAAMLEASTRISMRAEYASQWLDLVDAADRIVFEHDRDAWALAYENVGGDVAQAMRDTGNEEEPTPRHDALAKLRQSKQIAERPDA